MQFTQTVLLGFLSFAAFSVAHSGIDTEYSAVEQREASPEAEPEFEIDQPVIARDEDSISERDLQKNSLFRRVSLFTL
jgi:hypothetical protein